MSLSVILPSPDWQILRGKSGKKRNEDEIAQPSLLRMQEKKH